MKRQESRRRNHPPKKSTARIFRPNPAFQNLIKLLPYQKAWIEDRSRFRLVSKARQIGYSFIIAIEGALVARATRRNQIYLSQGERLSKLLAEKAANVVRAFDIAASDIQESRWADSDSTARCLQLQIEFPNGNKMYFLPARPETARSYSGDVYLDEFAFHQDAAKIYAALYPSITRGYRISIISTPYGQIGKYYEFAKSAGVVAGYAKDQYSPWSAHHTDIYKAVAEGLGQEQYPNPALNIRPEITEEIREGFEKRGYSPSEHQLRYVSELRAGMDERERWLQEYETEFLSDSRNYIPIELIIEAERDQIGTEQLPDRPLNGSVYMGIDIGRKQHRTVFWIQERVEDLLVTRAVVVLSKSEFSEQYRLAAQYMQSLSVAKCCVDSTGMGGQIAEQLEKDFPGRVEPVLFSLQSKEEMFALVRRTFEERRYRIPSNPIIRADINGLKCGVTRAGNLVFSAEETKEGHSDRTNALALATRAAQQPVCVGITTANFIGLDRPSNRPAPFVAQGESRDLTSLFGPSGWGGHRSGLRRIG